MMNYKELLENIKTYDIQLMDHDNIIIMCTGNAAMLEGRHGIIIETEEDYSDICTSGNSSNFLFENSVIVSLRGLLTSLGKDSVFIKRVRPSGFKSKSCTNKNTSFDIAIETFIQRNKDRIDSHKIRNLNTRGGVTVANYDLGALFDLTEAPILSMNKGEVIKRLKIGYEMLTELNKSSELSKELFDQIEEEMSELGCPYFTFSRPDEGVILRRDEKFSKYVEIRAFGLEKK